MKFASEELKKNTQVVLAAYKLDARNLRHISEEVRKSIKESLSLSMRNNIKIVTEPTINQDVFEIMGENFQIALVDLDVTLNFNASRKELTKMGNGWRLPTIKELVKIYNAFSLFLDYGNFEHDEKKNITQ